MLTKTLSLNTAATPSKTAPMPETIISAPANTPAR